MSYLVNPYMVEAESTTLWNQTSDIAEFLFNNYVTSAAISPLASAGIIGRTLRTFTLTLASTTATPPSAPVTFGVWTGGGTNTTRGSPNTEFICTSHTLTNFNQLTTSYIEYTFHNAVGHTITALDSIGYVFDSWISAGAYQKQKRSNYSSTAPEMSSSIYYNTSPTPQWLGNDVNQCPTSFGSSV